MKPPESTDGTAEHIGAVTTGHTHKIPFSDGVTLHARRIVRAGAAIARRVARRNVMRGALAGACALAVFTVSLAGPVPAGASTPPGQAAMVSRPHTAVDTSHATAAAAGFFAGYFRAKSDANVNQTMSFFSRTKLAYIDATVGLANYSWQSQYDTFAQFMPHWPAGSWSYPSLIVGDMSSAVVFYTDSAGLFGPNEIRAVGVLNFQAGKAVRWIDYWDGRQFGIANYDALKVPSSQFPTNFATNTVGEAKSRQLETVTHGLANALRRQDYAKAASYFEAGAVLTDYPSHVEITGARNVGEFLSRAGTLLPYVGPGTTVRHVVGSSAGGAYEWTAKGAVPRGVCALELDAHGKISRLWAMWNGALVHINTLQRLAGDAAKH